MVPVLLLTGFLGSGKTTLLNHILENRPTNGPLSEKAGKLALIVNEFGDAGIDGELLPDEMTRQIEIKGGCICCRLDDDLEQTILQLLTAQPDISAIVIETTGIAEPLPISWTLAKEELAAHVRLLAIVTVVDAVSHEEHRPLSPSVDAQVEYADLLVITKTDLAGTDNSRALSDKLRSQNAVAPIFYGTTEEIVQDLWRALDEPTFETRIPSESSPSEPSHSAQFQSLVLPISSTLDFEELSDALEALPGNYVRIKGFARVIDGAQGNTRPHMVVFHRVGARVSKEPVRDDVEPRLVAIGTKLDSAAIRQCLDDAVIE